MSHRSQAWSGALLAAGLLLALTLAAGTPPDAMLRWYLGLHRPWWQPPDWAIPLVWAAIFALLAIALRRAWRAAGSAGARSLLLGATLLNLFLNGLWAVLFFAWQRPDWSLWETVPLWLSVLLLLVLAAQHDRIAGWLLAPYLVWVALAAMLNLALLRLNAPLA